MKTKAKITSLLAVMLIFTAILSGCTNGENDKLIGKWKAGMNANSSLKESLSNYSKDIVVGSSTNLLIDVNFDFKEDNTYTMTYNREKFKKDSAKVASKLLEQYITNQASKNKITFEQMLKKRGYNNMDEMVSVVWRPEKYLDSLEDKNGYYLTNKGKLYLADSEADLDKFTDNGTYIEVAFTGGTYIKFNSFYSYGRKSSASPIVPLSLKKL